MPGSTVIVKWVDENGVPHIVDPTHPLPVTSEISADQGVASGGSNTTLVDFTKGWEVNMWTDAILQVVIGIIEYHRHIVSNTNDTLTINALPGVIAVVAGCEYSIKREINPLLPISRAIVHNVAGYIAAADILGADLAPLNTPCLFRVTACFNAAGVLSVETIAGGNSQVQQLYGGVALNNNSLYMFEHLVHAGDTINYRYSANATIMTFRVQEVIAAS